MIECMYPILLNRLINQTKRICMRVRLLVKKKPVIGKSNLGVRDQHHHILHWSFSGYGEIQTSLLSHYRVELVLLSYSVDSLEP